MNQTAEASTNPPEDDTVINNSPELRQYLSQALSQLAELKADRSATSETISAIYARIKERGINKKAFDMAMAYATLDQPQKEAFDVAYAIVREASGYPLQHDWVQEEAAPPPLQAVPSTATPHPDVVRQSTTGDGLPG